MISYSCCQSSDSKFEHIEKITSLLKLVAEPNRLKILCILSSGSHCVCEFSEHIQLSQSLLSHHLADLRKAGLIIGKKSGLNVHYSLTQNGKQIVAQVFSI
ncbi:MAG: winged helix-turn-helix transcriptional regulator [Candidatus Pacebacteria bacterium]|nr:winged helix-turn-helix transcriptional regulator [Candidatus Paceibacterota bacterium]